jgi:DNA-binding NarL/FixJ family response regulator
VLLVHPAAFAREALGSFLAARRGVTLAGAAADVDDARRLCASSAPDVALVCGSLLADEPVDGLPPTVALLGRSGPAAWLADEPDGLVAEHDDPDAVVEALGAVADGASGWVSPAAAAQLDAASPDHEAVAALTRRERDVLLLVAQGDSPARVADALGVRAGTVRNHLAAIYAKLDLTTCAEAVAWAWRHGLVQPNRAPAGRASLPGNRPTHDN